MKHQYIKLRHYLNGGKGTYQIMREEADKMQKLGWTVRIKKNEEYGFYLQITKRIS